MAKRILLVEDDEEVARLYEQWLTAAGYCAKVAVNGAEAYELVKRDGFHLLVIDHGLPDMRGSQLFRQCDAHTQCNVVFLTGGASEDLTDEARGRAVGVVSKPISRETLLEVVATGLSAIHHVD